MQRYRKRKLIIIMILMIGIASLSIGFAAFSATLNISSSASVTPNSDSFKVMFSTDKDSLKTDSVHSYASFGATAGVAVINNTTNPMITNLSASFTKPGDYVEYVFFARNEGGYTAYLNSINYLGEKVCASLGDATELLVQSACASISVFVTVGDESYSDSDEITGHMLLPGEGEEIKVRIVYASNGEYVDGDFSITLPNISLVYSTMNDSTIQPPISSSVDVHLKNGSIDLPGSEVCIGEECFYIISSTEQTITMIAKYNLLVGYNDICISEDENGLCEESQTIELDSSKVVQNESAKGSVEDENFIVTYPVVGYVYFSDDTQKGENYNSYNGSIVEKYVNEYRNYLSSLGVNVVDARILNVDEFECVSDRFHPNDELNCNRASYFYTTSYWIMGDNYSSQMIWGVNFGYNFIMLSRYDDFGYGVRPVIEIPLTELI